MKILHLTPDCNLSASINGSDADVIYLSKGIYRQKTLIEKSNVKIFGEGWETVITFDDCAKKIHADGKEYNTFRTYTLCVTGDNVRMENLTVENSNSAPERVGQCVALSVHGDNFVATNLNLVSTQDTLFLSPFPDDLVTRYRGFIPREQLYKEGGNVHLFQNCRICGTVDFIFGCAEAYFQGCEIVSLKDSRGVGYVAAPAHPLAAESGFSFVNCDFVSGGAENSSVYLARPWRDFGKCDFVNCKFGAHVNPALFDKWDGTDRDESARFAYHSLAGDIRPVEWGKKLTDGQANDIIADCLRKFREDNE